MDYEGEHIEIDMGKTGCIDYYLTLSQTIAIENDKGKACTNYPTQDFTSYRDCDEQFVYDEMKHTYNLMPFWAAKKIDEITELK